MEREDAGLLPLHDGNLDLRRPHEIGLIRSGGAVWVGALNIVVRAADLVLGAVTAVSVSKRSQDGCLQRHSPLWEALVAANVSTLAGFATFARLGVTPAGRTTTWASHCSELEVDVEAKDVKIHHTRAIRAAMGSERGLVWGVAFVAERELLIVS